MENHEGNSYERLLVNLIEKYELKQERLENTLSKIESEVRSLGNEVQYLVKAVRDGNDPISKQIIEHESRLKVLEKSEQESKSRDYDFSTWKRGAVTMAFVTLLSLGWNIYSAVYLHK